MIEQVSITTKSPEETFRFATALGRLLFPGDVVLLEGDLGVGKTLFSKGVAKGMGIKDEVTSPTFSLVAEYTTGRVSFVHMDLYRLYLEDSPSVLSEDTLSAISFEDYLDGTNVVFIEWPAGVVNRFDDALYIRMTPAPLPHVDTRELACRGTGPKSAERLRMWVTAWLSS